MSAHAIKKARKEVCRKVGRLERSKNEEYEGSMLWTSNSGRVTFGIMVMQGRVKRKARKEEIPTKESDGKERKEIYVDVVVRYGMYGILW